MNEANQTPQQRDCKPVVDRPKRHSIEEILRYVDPAPDEEIDRFLEAIYSDRRGAAATPLSD